MTDEEVSKLVFLREQPVAADLAIIFADATEAGMLQRVRRGVEVYQSGLVPKLMVTGGRVLARNLPEAKRMVQIAKELGVPASDLIVEDRSGFTHENAQNSAAMLEDLGLLEQLKVVLLVSSEWHMRRVLLTTRRFFPEGIHFVCCPTLEGCNRDNWTTSEACRKSVSDEALLLSAFLESGALKE
jgi:uncharacterized SAM-binding protein YcdF (DUF218 family)